MDYFEVSMKAESNPDRQALKRIVNRMEVTGEGISPLNRLLGKIGMLIIGVLLVFLIKDSFMVSFVVLLLGRLVIALILNQFRFRTHAFAYILTLGFLIYFAHVKYWTGFGLIMIHACLVSTNLALLIKNVKKSIRAEKA